MTDRAALDAIRARHRRYTLNGTSEETADEVHGRTITLRDSSAMTPDLDAIRARHFAFFPVDAPPIALCIMCRTIWPCDTERLLAALDLDQARKEGYLAGKQEMQAALDRAGAVVVAARALLEYDDGEPPVPDEEWAPEFLVLRAALAAV